MSLTFLIPSSTIRSSTRKNIKSVIGGQERLDVISRCLLNLARWNNRLGKEIRLLIYLSHNLEQKVLEIPITEKMNTLQSEIDSTHMLIEILANPLEYNADYIDISFKNLLDNLNKKSSIFYLTPNGLLIDKQKEISKEDSAFCFILGSQHDLSDEQEEALFNLNYIPTSIGEKNYLASHVITIVCNHLYNLNES